MSFHNKQIQLWIIEVISAGVRKEKKKKKKKEKKKKGKEKEYGTQGKTLPVCP